MKFNEFLQKNKEFWSQFRVKDSGKKILVETPCIGSMFHRQGVMTNMFNQAKGWQPIWLCKKKHKVNLYLAKSYCQNAEIANLWKILIFPHLIFKIFFLSLYKYIEIYFKKNILTFHYDNIRYGDILYDRYLNKFKTATIKERDLKLLYIILNLIFQHESITIILKNYKYAAVLVTHTISSSGIMLRAAIKNGLEAYFASGSQFKLVIQKYKNINDSYEYHLKPCKHNIEEIINTFGKKTKELYKNLFKMQSQGKLDWNSNYAFSKKNKTYCKREKFNKEYNLDNAKKNIFVMLHAFTDHPHSHFRWMLFKDYYDWFVQTLNFAKKNTKVNWIFKEHPSKRYYPIKQDIPNLFKNSFKNIVYIDDKHQINTISLKYCADLIITCIGSAGFELPAMAGIPALIAGDTFYNELGFTLEPKTKEKYFTILNNIENIKKLNHNQITKAQVAYLYIHLFAKTPFYLSLSSSMDITSLDKNPDWQNKIIKAYQEKKELILKELNEYIKQLKKENFKSLKMPLEDYKI